MKTILKKSIIIALTVGSIFNSVKAQSIAAGGWHTLAICSDSTVKAFGENATGELGDGSTTDRNIPTPVIGLTGIIAVSGGGDQLEAHSMALKSNGNVYAWGSNLYGGLGNGTTTSSMVPVQVLNMSNAIAIDAGGWHSVALKNDNTVWTWGWNTDGQLGDGTTTDKTIPMQVAGLSDVKAISAGTYHVLALKNDGTVWAWGDNISGQIGDGSTTDRTTPVQVTGLTNVSAIATGRFFSLAVKNDGTVWTWGENLYGQLGNNTTVNSSVPVQVTGITGVTSIVTCGAFECHVVKNDNTVWAWGRNTYGNLGDGTTTHRSVPVQTLGISDVIELAAGTNFSLFVKNDGTFWGCGRNASGQLGDSTFLQRNTLVQSNGLCPVIQFVSNDKPISDLFETQVYPNPSTGTFNLKIKSNYPTYAAIEEFKIEIFNSVGAKIYQSKVKEQTSIDLNEYSSGIYYLKISYGETEMNHKLVKM